MLTETALLLTEMSCGVPQTSSLACPCLVLAVCPATGTCQHHTRVQAPPPSSMPCSHAAEQPGDAPAGRGCRQGCRKGVQEGVGIFFKLLQLASIFTVCAACHCRQGVHMHARGGITFKLLQLATLSTMCAACHFGQGVYVGAGWDSQCSLMGRQQPHLQAKRSSSWPMQICHPTLQSDALQ
jgi:hypothetical protein